MLIDYYDNRIRFCPSHKVNEPEMCFSADISIDDLTRTIRNRDVVTSASEILRESFRNVDFKLEDSFCDGSELKESLEKTHMPDQVLTFFAALFGNKRSRMLKIEMLRMENIYDDICTENEADMNENSDIEKYIQMKIQWMLNGLFTISTTNCIAFFRLYTINFFTGLRKPL